MNSTYTINLLGKIFTLDKPKIMGIINITPDSYWEQSRATHSKDVLKKAALMIEQGADILDVGACSTRPGSTAPSPEEEWNRLKEILPQLVKEFPDIPISIDTYRSAVAQRALDGGVAMINDVSMGAWDAEILSVAAQHQVPYVLTHSRGLPEVMQQNTDYQDIIAEVFKSLSEKIAELKSKGINDILIDPGFGFGKAQQHNYQLLAHLSHFSLFKHPILVGISRKSMIYKALNTTPDEVLTATSALHFAALQNGAQILRVHDVKEAKQVIDIFEIYQQNQKTHAV